MRSKWLALCAFLIVLQNCASSPDEGDAFLDSSTRSPARVYNSGLDYLFARQYLDAISEFKRVEDQYPYSFWVQHALLMAGFTHYLINQYDQAVAFLDRFIALYPGAPEIAYAYYLRAMCFYEQIGETNRDNSSALRAQQAFQQVVGFYPNSIYTKDSLLKLDLIHAALAAHEMYVARWLMERQRYSAALNRFHRVITQYQKTAFVPEALHRRVEIYLTLGLDEEAKYSAAILGFNYPDNIWYKHSYRLLQSAQRVGTP